MSGQMFKVGDYVAVIDGRRVLRMSKVKRVMKPFIQLDDGSKWSHAGIEYPRPRSLFRRHIELVSAEEYTCDQRHARRSALLGKMCFNEWRSLPAATVDHIWSAVLEANQ